MGEGWRNKIAATLVAFGISGDMVRPKESIEPVSEPDVAEETVSDTDASTDAEAVITSTGADDGEDREEGSETKVDISEVVSELEHAFPGLKSFNPEESNGNYLQFIRSLKPGDFYFNVLNTITENGEHVPEISVTEMVNPTSSPIHSRQVLRVSVSEEDGEKAYTLTSGPSIELTRDEVDPDHTPGIDVSGATEPYVTDVAGSAKDLRRKIRYLREFYELEASDPDAHSVAEGADDTMRQRHAANRLIEKKKRLIVFCDAIDPETGRPVLNLDMRARAAIRDYMETIENFMGK